MFTSRIRNLLRDERGGYTIWATTWFMLYLAIGGLAVDASNAYRNQAALQSAADSAALAAAIFLPDEADAIDDAVAYATDNMDALHNGIVLTPEDVTFGSWNFDTKTFTPDTSMPNAVRVVTRRASANGNPVAMNMLRILALFGLNPNWNIDTEAIAVGLIPGCINDGLVAQNHLNYASNNNFYNGICLHGQDDGVGIQNGNHHDPDVRIGMGDLADFDYPGETAYQEAQDNLAEGDVYPMDTHSTLDIIAALRDLPSKYNPNWGFVYKPKGNSGNYDMPAHKTHEPTGNKTWEPYTVYDINCNGQINIGSDVVLENIVIIANCRIHAAADVSAGNVVIASTVTDTDPAAIDLAAKSQLGLADGCTPGGGVEVYTPGDVHVSAQGDWHGVRIVSGHDVKMTSNFQSIWGISVQAGHDIQLSSNNQFGLCDGGVPGPVTWQYRLVR